MTPSGNTQRSFTLCVSFTSSRVVVMNFQEHTTAVRFERTVMGTGRATSVGVRLERLPHRPHSRYCRRSSRRRRDKLLPNNRARRAASCRYRGQTAGAGSGCRSFHLHPRRPIESFCWMPSGYPGGTSQPLLKSTA